MADDPQIQVHRAWLSMLQPVGLVVSPPALVATQCVPDRQVTTQQAALRTLVEAHEATHGSFPRSPAGYTRFADLARDVLQWDLSLVHGAPDAPPVPDALSVVLPEFGETLRADLALPDLGAPPGAPRWQLLVVEAPHGADLDAAPDDGARGWHASPQARIERLLRETDTPAGILSNGTSLRLVCAPRGESSGHLTWPVYALCEVPGRPLLAALCMLLGAFRLFAAPKAQSLPTVLRESRRYQSVVSTALAEQVLGALHDLVRGFQSADDLARGALLGDTLREAPDEVYGGLLTVLLRMVFVLYAEDRGLLGGDGLFARSYALTALYAQLREDAARHPDTMDQRFGAWSRVLVLCRLVHDGAPDAVLALPPRYGRLFDPDAYPFLEGRPRGSLRQQGERLTVPKVSDGVVHRVLDALLVLDGERLSYRALDVEQIGSVYEAMMGFALRTAQGPSIAVRPQHVVVDLGALCAMTPAERIKHLADEAGCKLPAGQAERVRAARSVEAIVAALDTRVSPRTPRVIPPGAMFLQPGEERRRSGSHYTPRSLTEPIVRTTLRPVLEALGPRPTSAQVLALTVCDPAMGSGAFLVEACRALGDVLVASWQVHGMPDDLPPGEDPVLHARRLVAQRCLYGVDKNPFAVDLARLSLWLVTLARAHPFTFLDHCLRQGDSLVGLSREQLASVHWEVGAQVPTVRAVVDRAVRDAEAKRQEIHAKAMGDDVREKRRLLDDAERALTDVRALGDSVVAAFFDEEKDAARKKRVRALRDRVEAVGVGDEGLRAELTGIARGLRERARPVTPFHWEIEFPEVFSRENPGFDAVVGNPPFLGGTVIGTRLGIAYHHALMEFHQLHETRLGNADLVAFFLDRAFESLRDRGCLGLVTTNTIAQGDTRQAGLERVCRRGGLIFDATSRLVWPGAAAVVVSVIHVARGQVSGAITLNGRGVESISPYLFPGHGDATVVQLRSNYRRAFRGGEVRGAGFLFESVPRDGSSSIEEMKAIFDREPSAREVIHAYLGGEEFNSSPTLSADRFVINFRDWPEETARKWPAPFAIVEERVKPVRAKVEQRDRRELWWMHVTRVPEVMTYLDEHQRVLAVSQVSKYLGFGFVSGATVCANTLILLLLNRHSGFAAVQSRVHEAWSKFVGSSMKDDLRYTPTDCFETFPFPDGVLEASRGDAAAQALPAVRRLEDVGQRYYDFRAGLMVAHDEGLTVTYNRFHDPDETDDGILRLRALHAEMDRAVLDAYGWTDLAPRCEFLLDYEEGDDDADDAPGRRRKRKPWRYRWPDEVRDEVLARLIALNGEQAKQEAAATLAAGGAGGAKRKGGGKRKGPPEGQGGLFG